MFWVASVQNQYQSVQPGVFWKKLFICATQKFLSSERIKKKIRSENTTFPKKYLLSLISLSLSWCLLKNLQDKMWYILMRVETSLKAWNVPSPVLSGGPNPLPTTLEPPRTKMAYMVFKKNRNQ